MHLRLPGVCCELNRSHTKGKKQQNQPAALSCRTAVCCSPFGPPQPNNATQFDANPPPLLQPTPRGFSPIPPWHLGPGPPPHTQRSPAPCLHIYLKAMPPQPCAHRNVAILASPPPPHAVVCTLSQPTARAALGAAPTAATSALQEHSSSAEGPNGPPSIRGQRAPPKRVAQKGPPPQKRVPGRPQSVCAPRL